MGYINVISLRLHHWFPYIVLSPIWHVNHVKAYLSTQGFCQDSIQRKFYIKKTVLVKKMRHQISYTLSSYLGSRKKAKRVTKLTNAVCPSNYTHGSSFVVLGFCFLLDFSIYSISTLLVLMQSYDSPSASTLPIHGMSKWITRINQNTFITSPRQRTIKPRAYLMGCTAITCLKALQVFVSEQRLLGGVRCD